jgi:signal transduction histidine kinase
VKGAGLGLAIVKELVAAHGGRVGADRSEKGARVWFTLPRGR